MTMPVNEYTMTKMEEIARKVFTPAQYAALGKQTENADESVRESYRYDLLSWACDIALAEKQSKVLRGLFNGTVRLASVQENGTPRFVVRHGTKV